MRAALALVLLGGVAHAREPRLTIQRVVLDVDLRVERDDLALARDDERVDLDEARVALVKQLHELGEQLRELRLLLLAELEPEREPPCLVARQPARRVQRDREDLLGSLLGDLLDVHAAGARGDDRDALGRAVDEHAEVNLALDVGSGLHVDPVHGQPVGTALVRGQARAEHGLGVRLDLLRRPGELDAARLAAAAGVHLGLDDPERAAERLGDGPRLARARRGAALRHGDRVFREQGLGLVFVQVQREIPSNTRRKEVIFYESDHIRKAAGSGRAPAFG